MTLDLHRLLLLAFAGPNSAVGRALAAIGLVLVADRPVAYVVGFVVVIVCVHVIGLFVNSQLRTGLASLTARFIGRIPLIGSIYGLMNRFVGVFGKQDTADTAAMAPVWCFFGNYGTAVLALLAAPDVLLLNGGRYLAVLVPTAPVPFGGGLLFHPAESVIPAAIGAEALTSIYVSMGMTAPQFLPVDTSQ